MDDHRKLYRRIFSIERFIRNLTRSISTMCDSATATGGLVGGTYGAGGATTANGVDMGAAVAAAAAAAAAAAHAATAEQSACGGGGGCATSGCGGTTAVGSAGCVASSASALLAKRERRLRLQKVGSYRVGRTLGRGNFAQVRVAYHEVANAKVAMKIVDKRSLDEENLAKIEREIRILQQLSHPYIVRLYEVIRTERYLYIVTEYVSNGELFDMLMDRGRQTEAESRRLFQQIVSAVAYCHANGIVHRDLKAENLLLDKRGNIKIIDFGFSNYHQPGQLLSTWCGSPPYAAPELLLAQEYDGRQSDVWSLGVILYILVTAGFPFPGDSVEKLKRAVLSDHLKIPFWVSVECADLIRKMLIVQPAKRCTLQYITQHKWFICDMPEHIKQQLLAPQLSSSAAATTVDKQQETRAPYTVGGGGRAVQQQQQQLDPTVLIFMQQHMGWSDEQIIEEVLGRNYESSVFGTYALLLSRLSDIREAEAVAAAAAAAAAASASGTGGIIGGTSSGSNSNSSSNGGIAAAMMASPLVFGGGGAARATATAMALNTIVGGSCTNLQLDSEYARRGSRGSIISGRANVEPAEQQHHATIPAHHLAKLSLSTSPDYQETDDSDSASDWSMVPNSSAGVSSADDAAAAVVPPPPPPSTTSVSPTQPQHHHNHHHTAPCVAPPAASSSSSYYKSKRHHHRAGRRGVAAAAPRATATPAATTQFDQQQQQRAAYVALEQQYHQLNPLLNAAAQQFAVDTSRAAWANAAAAAALFASQLQQQHTGSNSCSTTNSSSVVVISDAARHQLQQAAALNLVSLQNFPFVDYAARMMHVPTQERRASANEALLGLNSYAHLLAACSTMGGSGANTAGTGGCSTGTASSSCPTAGPSPAPPLSSSAMATDQQQQQQHSQPNTRCSSSHGTLSSSSAGNASPCRRRQSLAASANGGGVVAGAAPPIAAPAGVHHQQHRHHNGARHPAPLARRSVEEEGEYYLCGQRGSGKRNTVHSITAGVPLLLGTSGHAQKQQHQQHQSAQSSAFQRHTRTPYAKQGSSFGTGVMGGAERRSSWASSSAGSPVLAINAQQHAQLERLYRQSIGQQQTNPSSSCPPSESSAASVAAGVSNVVQQLQHEFQKLCAASSTSTKEGSPPSLSDSTPQHHHHNHHQLSSATVSANTIAAAAAAAVGASAQLLPRGAPTISITDENNRHSMFGGGVAATVIAATTPYDRHQHQQLLSAILEQHQQQHQQINENEDDEMVVENTSINNYNSNNNNNLSQSLPHQRPATVCGFSTTTPSGVHPTTNIDDPAGLPPPPTLLKFVYIPVSIRTALERLQRVVDAHKLLCELQSDDLLCTTLMPDQMGGATAENVNAIRVRVAPPPSPPAPPHGEHQLQQQQQQQQNPSSPTPTPLSSATILELCLFRMDQSPNISRASFSHVQGDADQFEALRQTLLCVFNEVL